MLGLLTGRAGRYLLAALVGAVAVMAIYQAGRSSARHDAAERIEQTRKDVRGIEDDTRKASDDGLTDWLSKPLGLFGFGDG